MYFFFFKQKTAYEMRISDWSSDVCSSDLLARQARASAVHSLVARPVAVLRNLLCYLSNVLRGFSYRSWSHRARPDSGKGSSHRCGGDGHRYLYCEDHGFWNPRSIRRGCRIAFRNDGSVRIDWKSFVSGKLVLRGV